MPSDILAVGLDSAMPGPKTPQPSWPGGCAQQQSARSLEFRSSIVHDQPFTEKETFMNRMNEPLGHEVE